MTAYNHKPTLGVYRIDDFLRYQGKLSTENGEERLPYGRVKKIINEGMDVIKKELMSGNILKMPGLMGKLTIKRKEVNYDHPQIDRWRSHFYGKTMYRFHIDTDGWYPNVTWGPMEFMKNKTIFVFKVNKEVEEEIMENFQTHYKDFIPYGAYDIDNLKQIYQRNKDIIKK